MGYPSSDGELTPRLLFEDPFNPDSSRICIHGHRAFRPSLGTLNGEMFRRAVSVVPWLQVSALAQDASSGHFFFSHDRVPWVGKGQDAGNESPSPTSNK
jgi:hypothetical protein